LNNINVASFVDTNPSDTVQNLSATITWGDGHVTLGKVVQGAAPDLFNVQGSNTYLAPGTYAISVLVTNSSGQTAIANSTAIVAAPVIATGTTFPVVPGQAFIATVASFTDS